ncbi:MAG: EamA family transporter [Acidobacteriota bacterium]
MYSERGTQIRMLLRDGQILNVGGPAVNQADGRKHAVSRGQQRVSTVSLVLAFAAIYLIWGSTYLAIRYAVESIPPLLMMAARHFTAGTLLYAWLRFRGTPAPIRIHWRNAAIAGGLFFLGSHGTLAWAEQKVPSGLAALLCATLPLWIVVLSPFMGKKRNLSRKVIAGLVLGFIGVAVLIGPTAFHSQGGLSLLGAAVVLLASLLWAVGTMYTQRAGLPSSSSLSSAMQMMTGGVLLCVVGLMTGEAGRLHLSAVTLKSGLALAYLTIFGSLVAFTAFTWLHQVSSPTRNSTYAYVNPVVAVFVGWLFAGEAVSIMTLVATAIILSGVALVNRAEREPMHEHPASDHQESRRRSGGPEYSAAAD